MKDLLGRTRQSRSGACLGSAVPGIMAGLSALETSPLSHAFHMLLGGEFFESDCINLHGIWVGGSSGRGGVWSSEVGVLCPSP